MPDQGLFEPYASYRKIRFKELVKRYMSKGASQFKAECVARRNMKRKW